MNTTTALNVDTNQETIRETDSEGFEALKELADFELAYVGGGTASVIFV